MRTSRICICVLYFSLDLEKQARARSLANVLSHAADIIPPAPALPLIATLIATFPEL